MLMLAGFLALGAAAMGLSSVVDWADGAPGEDEDFIAKDHEQELSGLDLMADALDDDDLDELEDFEPDLATDGDTSEDDAGDEGGPAFEFVSDGAQTATTAQEHAGFAADDVFISPWLDGGEPETVPNFDAAGDELFVIWDDTAAQSNGEPEMTLTSSEDGQTEIRLDGAVVGQVASDVEPDMVTLLTRSSLSGSIWAA